MSWTKDPPWRGLMLVCIAAQQGSACSKSLSPPTSSVPDYSKVHVVGSFARDEIRKRIKEPIPFPLGSVVKLVVLRDAPDHLGYRVLDDQGKLLDLAWERQGSYTYIAVLPGYSRKVSDAVLEAVDRGATRFKTSIGTLPEEKMLLTATSRIGPTRARLVPCNEEGGKEIDFSTRRVCDSVEISCEGLSRKASSIEIRVLRATSFDAKAADIPWVKAEPSGDSKVRIPIPNASRQSALQLLVTEVKEVPVDEELNLGFSRLETHFGVPVFRVDPQLSAWTTFGATVRIPRQFTPPSRRPAKSDNGIYPVYYEIVPNSARAHLWIELIRPTPEELNVEEIQFYRATENRNRRPIRAKRPIAGVPKEGPFQWRVRVTGSSWIPTKQYKVVVPIERLAPNQAKPRRNDVSRYGANRAS